MANNAHSSKKNSYKKIRKKLEDNLKEDRYDHTLGVAKTAQMIAHFYDVDSDKAYLAGLLHDCAKNISTKESLTLCEKKHIKLTKAELDNPKLIHAKLGVVIAKEEYGIDDEEILNAISSHTTGRPDMSDLEKIIYIADYIEPGRVERENYPYIRRLVLDSLDEAMLVIARDCLEYLKTTGTVIDPMTQETYDYYLELVNNKNC